MTTVDRLNLLFDSTTMESRSIVGNEVSESFETII